MPGTILSAEARKRIAECHIKTAEFATSREMLIEIYKAARLSLVKGTLFDSVVVALSKRASELGVTKRGSNNDARLS